MCVSTVLAIVLVALCSNPVIAIENSEEGESVFLADSAGSHGYYSFNGRTGECTFVLPEEYDPAMFSLEENIDFENNIDETGDISPSTVINGDNRARVTDTSIERYSSTCLIIVVYKNGAKNLVQV